MIVIIILHFVAQLPIQESIDRWYANPAPVRDQINYGVGYGNADYGINGVSLNVHYMASVWWACNWMPLSSITFARLSSSSSFARIRRMLL